MVSLFILSPQSPALLSYLLSYLLPLILSTSYFTPLAKALYHPTLSTFTPSTVPPLTFVYIPQPPPPISSLSSCNRLSTSLSYSYSHIITLIFFSPSPTYLPSPPHSLRQSTSLTLPTTSVSIFLHLFSYLPEDGKMININYYSFFFPGCHY